MPKHSFQQDSEAQNSGNPGLSTSQAVLPHSNKAVAELRQPSVLHFFLKRPLGLPQLSWQCQPELLMRSGTQMSLALTSCYISYISTGASCTQHFLYAHPLSFHRCFFSFSLFSFHFHLHLPTFCFLPNFKMTTPSHLNESPLCPQSPLLTVWSYSMLEDRICPITLLLALSLHAPNFSAASSKNYLGLQGADWHLNNIC